MDDSGETTTTPLYSKTSNWLGVSVPSMAVTLWPCSVSFWVRLAVTGPVPTKISFINWLIFLRELELQRPQWVSAQSLESMLLLELSLLRDKLLHADSSAVLHNPSKKNLLLDHHSHAPRDLQRANRLPVMPATVVLVCCPDPGGSILSVY